MENVIVDNASLLFHVVVCVYLFLSAVYNVDD